MRFFALVLLLAFGALPVGAAIAPSESLDDRYPAAGANYVPAETGIMFRPGGGVDPGALMGDDILDVRGSFSGPHRGRIRVADDGETILFQPEAPFHPGEAVHVRLRPGLRTSLGPVPATQWSFTVSRGRGVPDAAWTSSIADLPQAAHDSLPADFPVLTRTMTGPASPGYLFLSNIAFGRQIPNYLLIVDDDGKPVFQRRLTDNAFDFKVQPDGRATYFDASTRRYYALNASFERVDSFACGNGYDTDLHELRLLPNGHALLMSYDPQSVDMSRVVPGGDPNATVVGLVIQEIDREKRVVFQWRSWDHFEITDATHIDLTAPVVDYAHGNSIEVDADGNLIVSSRHMDEITKISRRNGKVLWRLGGKNNQFAVTGDPTGFSHQHCARRLPNGNLLFFDNANFNDPPGARAVEYRLDEARKTAVQVWEYRPSPPILAFAMGSVQRLSNGNTVIGWGTGNPSVTEVNRAGEKVSELAFAPGVMSYRAFRCEWPPVREADVRLTPSSIQAAGGGPWIDATIRVEGAGADPVDAGSVRLAGVAPVATPKDASDGAGPADATRVRFARADLMPLLHPGANELELRGALRAGGALRGTATLRVSEPARPSRITLEGNRTGGRAPIVLYLGAAAAGEYEVAIFDVRGALVRRWSARLGPEAPLRWDGRAAGDAPAASGVYFVRVRRDDAEAVAKVVIAR